MRNPTPQQRATRARALTLRLNTDAWVLTDAINEAIHKGHLTKASRLIKEQRQHWPDDPELTRADSLIAFLRGTNKRAKKKSRKCK